MESSPKYMEKRLPGAGFRPCGPVPLLAIISLAMPLARPSDRRLRRPANARVKGIDVLEDEASSV